ncbi:MAG: Nif3-like dinuclear metal center hexameric protein [Flavobacteriales bacterium]|nr:Nif3-like dinuclear metal center hexameric protein [Flavobacteriales bacterium]
MTIAAIIDVLEKWAPPSLQEDYDNSGFQVGNSAAEAKAALVCVDCNEAVVLEAEREGCNLIICHHPVIFKGLKRLVGRTAVERTIELALRKNIAIYAIHTNLDNVIDGVNGEIARRLGLKPISVLDPRTDRLRKLAVFVPEAQAEALRTALFEAGAGQIGAYDHCSFNLVGSGTFRAGEGADPFVGMVGERHTESEVRVEVVYVIEREGAILAAMKAAHPYEEVAYDLLVLANAHPGIGSGLLGELSGSMTEHAFLDHVKAVLGQPHLRHSALTGKTVRKVAVCGGSGSFLLGKARAAGAEAFVTADLKYHQFQEPDGALLLVDAGHWQTEQYTMDLIRDRLVGNIPTFAVRLSGLNTDPIHYR